MLTLIRTRKSNNPNAKVDKASGYNVATDGRLYYIAVFSDPTNPFAPQREKVISQQFDSQHNPVWKGGDPEVIKGFIGKQVEAKAVTLPVEEYEVNGRMVSIYTAVVLGHENTETVFRNAGHPIVDTATGEVKTEKASATLVEKTEPIGLV